jgi:hypothetical protein
MIQTNIYTCTYIYTVYNTVVFLHTLLRYNTIFTYIRKFFLIIGNIFNVFLGPDKQLQVFLTPGFIVISDRLRSYLFTKSRRYVLTPNKKPKCKIQPDEMRESNNITCSVMGWTQGRGEHLTQL